MLEAIIGKWLAGRLLNCAWDQVKAASHQPELLNAFEAACGKGAQESPILFSDYTASALNISATQGENLATRLQESFGTASFPTPEALAELLVQSWRLRKEALKPEEAAPLFQETENIVRPFLQRLADLFFRELALVESLRSPFVISALQRISADSAELVAQQRLAETNEELRQATDIIPEPIKVLLDEARGLADEGHYTAARAKCQQALHAAQEQRHPLAEIKAKIGIASTFRKDDPDTARPLYRECLEQLRTTHSERLREEVLGQLGDLEALSGNLLEGKALLTEALEIARSLEDRTRIAASIQSLAWIANGEGKTDDAIKLFEEAILLFMTEYQRHEPATEKKAMRGLGACFNNKSLAHKHQTDLIGALASLEQAIAWFRKSESKDDLATALFLLAEARFAEAKWQEGTEHLEESLKIATELDDYIWMSRCLDLFGKLNYMLGRRTEALDAFENALALMREKGKPDQAVDCLGKVARFYAENGQKDEARKLLNEAKDLSEKHELLEDYADSILELAKLEEGDDSDPKRAAAATEAVGVLGKLLLRAQVKGRRAFLMGRIGALHQQLGSSDEALDWFQQAKQVFEEIGDVHGIVNCYGSIAEIRHKQEKPDEEMVSYQHILALARGKPMPDLIAGTKINMGNALMSYGRFREAKQLFEEAADLCDKHRLRKFQPVLLSNLERVQHFIESYKPATLDFQQLMGELHELVTFFPEAKDSILRFWYYARDVELHANCRSLVGVKLFIVEDDTLEFLEVVEKFAAYTDLNLQAVNTKFPGWVFDVVPYPKNKILPKRVAVPAVREDADGTKYVAFMRGGLHWPYSLCSDEVHSKESGQTGVIIAGQARGLPPQAHDLMLGHSVDELVSKKVFFFPVEQSVLDERLLNDLRLAKEQGLIPLYRDRLPDSEDVEVVASIPARFPVITPAVAKKLRSQISLVKRKLVRALSVSEQEAVETLGEVAEKLESIDSSNRSKDAVSVTLYLLRHLFRGVTEHHVAMVRQTTGENSVAAP
jgi:tetratricopeptide (TPR) repeat protein